MIKIRDILKEVKAKYDYGCVMLNCTFPEEVIQAQQSIKPEDLYIAEDSGGYGIETEAHCTLLYGLHEGVTLEEVKSKLAGIVFTQLRATGPTLFQNEKFDVLKYDVTYLIRGLPFLTMSNRRLKELPNTQTYPDYHPHMTIAYLKPGLGEKYESLFKGRGLSEFITTPQYAEYSEPSGTKTKFNLKIV